MSFIFLFLRLFLSLYLHPFVSSIYLSNFAPGTFYLCFSEEYKRVGREEYLSKMMQIVIKTIKLDR